MPSAKYFSKYPPFPSGVPLVDIPTISLSKIEEGSDSESSKVFQACREHGFFLLELQSSTKGQNLIRDAETLFDLIEETFELGPDVLNKYSYQPPKSLLGYKATGKLKTDDGKLDAMEMFILSRDDILGQDVEPQPKPDLLELHEQKLQDFCLHANEALFSILDVLDKQLDLPQGTLRSLSPLDRPSESTVRLLQARPSSLTEGQRVSLGGHTDLNAITMLFNVVGGLQILPAGSKHVYENWRYVRPQPGCAIVNLGDTLVQWTGGVLKSSLHRVHSPPGDQAGTVRQSLGYFVRPSLDASMQRLRGGSVIPALADGEEDETMSVKEWAEWRSKEIIAGRLKPDTRGGIPIKIDHEATVSA